MKQRKNSIKALRRRRQAEKRAEAARRVEEEQRRAALRVELEAERARSRAAAAARQRLATEPTVPAGDPPPRLEVRLGEEQPRPRSRPGSGMRLEQLRRALADEDGTALAMRLEAAECQRLRPLYVASRAEVLALTQERARLGEELNRAQAAVTEMQALMVRVSEGYRDRDQRSAARAREWEEHLRGLLAALRQAQAALTWGHAEMKGRPPQHWLDAMAAVARALDPSSGLPEEGPEAPGAVQGSAVSPEQAAQERDRDG